VKQGAMLMPLPQVDWVFIPKIDATRIKAIIQCNNGAGGKLQKSGNHAPLSNSGRLAQQSKRAVTVPTVANCQRS